MKSIKIKSIRKLPNKNDRYDLTVPATNNFFANGILIHNTSQRYAFVADVLPLTRWEKFKQKLGFKVAPQLEYKLLAGTRRVELRPSTGNGFYGTTDFRTKLLPKLEGLLRKGEVIYGELVGYTNTGAPIQPPGDPKLLQDKNFARTYGDKMPYSYGCVEGTCEFYVYRIVMVNEDGLQTDLTWPQTKYRCEQLGLKHVPDLYGPILLGGNASSILLSMENYEYLGNGEPNCYEALQKLVQQVIDGPSVLNPKQCKEGVCIRVENQFGMTIYKEKSWPFKVMEQGVKDEGILDIEEAQEVVDGKTKDS